MRATILPKPIIQDQCVGIKAIGYQYCGPGSGSEVILIFTTQLHSSLSNYNALFCV